MGIRQVIVQLNLWKS